MKQWVEKDMTKIRKMRPEDRGAIREILTKTEMFTIPEVDVAMELVDIFLNNSEQKDYLIYVAESEARVTGYVCYGPTPAAEGTFDLYWIAVAPDQQGKGIGKELLEFVEQEVKQMKGRLIIIETSSQEKYTPTQQFYLKNHYLIAARIKDFYRVGDDRLIFVKYF